MENILKDGSLSLGEKDIGSKVPELVAGKVPITQLPDLGVGGDQWDNLLGVLAQNGINVEASISDKLILKDFETPIPNGYGDINTITDQGAGIYRITEDTTVDTWDNLAPTWKTLVGQEIIVGDDNNYTTAVVSAYNDSGGNYLDIECSTDITSWTTNPKFRIHVSENLYGINFDNSIAETNPLSKIATAYLSDVKQQSFTDKQILLRMLWTADSWEVVKFSDGTTSFIARGDESAILKNTDEVFIFSKVVIDGEEFYIANGNGLVSLNADSTYYEETTVAFDNTTNIITITGHSFSNGDPVEFTTDGSLPSELSVNTVYYIVNVSGDTFQLAAEAGGSAIAFTDNGSGNHVAIRGTTVNLASSYSVANGTQEMVVTRNPIEKFRLHVGAITDTESFTDMVFKECVLKRGGSGLEELFFDTFNRSDTYVNYDQNYSGQLGNGWSITDYTNTTGPYASGIDSAYWRIYCAGSSGGNQYSVLGYRYDININFPINIYFDLFLPDDPDVDTIFKLGIGQDDESLSSWHWGLADTGLYVYIRCDSGSSSLYVGDQDGSYISTGLSGTVNHNFRIRFTKNTVKIKRWTGEEPSIWNYEATKLSGRFSFNSNNFFGICGGHNNSSGGPSIKLYDINILKEDESILQSEYETPVNQSGQKIVMNPQLKRNSIDNNGSIKLISGDIKTP